MFITISYGIPSIEQELASLRPNRLAVMKKVWEHSKAFDGTSVYQPLPDRLPELSVIQRLLAHTVYNPAAQASIGWQRTGDCRLEDIVAEVATGLETDDDIIQQFMDADNVLKLLRSATSFEEMVDRVRCVCGEFEGNERLQGMMEAVLGKNWAEEE